MTKSGVELVLGSIALAEERRTEAEHDALILMHLSQMQLQAVMKNAPTKVISKVIPVPEDGGSISPLLTDDTASVAQLVASSDIELTKLPGTFREGDTVDVDSVNNFDESQSIASAVISGGQLERQIYRLGDFVQKNPALGLARVHSNYVQLVDRYGQFYRLDLLD
jgi:hypothetical protein